MQTRERTLLNQRCIKGVIVSSSEPSCEVNGGIGSEGVRNFRYWMLCQPYMYIYARKKTKVGADHMDKNTFELVSKAVKEVETVDKTGAPTIDLLALISKLIKLEAI